MVQSKRAHSSAASRTTKISRLIHDLANALASVSARVSVLATRDLPDTIRRDLEPIVEDTARARELLREIVRASASHPRQRFSFLESVKRAIVASGLEDEDVAVALACDADSADVHGNQEQLDAVLDSLFAAEVEALRHSPGDRRVDVCLGREAGRWVLTVRTTSPEIPEADLPRLLSPFFLKQANGFGSGLSFGVCAQIARDHEGRLSIGRGPAGGREYRIELSALGLPRRRKRPAAPAETPAASTSGSRHVLVIDDDERVLDSYGLMVKHLGYTMEPARSGEEALRCLDQTSFAAVILDFHLGGAVDGADVVREVQRRRPELLPRLLLSTGDPDSHRLQELAARLGLRVLAKPFGVQDLRAAIEAIGEP